MTDFDPETPKDFHGLADEPFVSGFIHGRYSLSHIEATLTKATTNSARFDPNSALIGNKPPDQVEEDNHEPVSYFPWLTELLEKYNKVDDAVVSIFRVKPEMYRGKAIKGFTRRWPCSAFKTVEELLETIEREYGGEVWEIKFYEECGIHHAGTVRTSIDALAKPL